MKNKLFKTILTIALLSTPSIAHAKGEETRTKPYKNIKLQTKDGDIIYKILDKFLPSLNSSTQRINNNALLSLGYSGQGYTVAVVDTAEGGWPQAHSRALLLQKTPQI